MKVAKNMKLPHPDRRLAPNRATYHQAMVRYIQHLKTMKLIVTRTTQK